MINPHKLPKSTVKSLSERLKDEYDAHRIYRYISNCLENSGYELAAAYYAKEAEDELEHAKKLQKYATDWNVELEFLQLSEIPEIEGIDGAINAQYELEYNLLKSYQSDCKEAFEEGDLSTYMFLLQFVEIQTKAVAEVSTFINKMMLFDQKDKNWLFNFEKKIFGQNKA